ncbi:MAG: hypothetical protein ABF289_16265 [Clostridiales bacterium]
MVIKLSKLSLSIILVIVLVFSTVATVSAVTSPVINSFTSSATSISAGDTVTLKWNVSNAQSIEIVGLEKLPEDKLPLVGKLEVLPFTSTTYVLLAHASDGSMKSKAITVNVDAKGKVSIKYFTASDSEIELGDTVTLNYKVLNAKSIEIVGLEKQIECNPNVTKDSIKVWPLASTTYVLLAVGYNGEMVSAKVTVNVVKKQDEPVINVFKASSYSVSRGTLVSITWDTDNVSSCSIVTSDGITLADRPADGSISLTPNITRSYTLVAVGTNGEKVSKTITIVVN